MGSETRRKRRPSGGDDSGIDYSDIPASTEEQLGSAIRFRDFQRLVTACLAAIRSSASSSFSVRFLRLMSSAVETVREAGPSERQLRKTRPQWLVADSDDLSHAANQAASRPSMCSLARYPLSIAVWSESLDALCEL